MCKEDAERDGSSADPALVSSIRKMHHLLIHTLHTFLLATSKKKYNFEKVVTTFHEKSLYFLPLFEYFFELF